MTALRPGRDEDAAGFIALISACWAEYPGCVFDLDGEVPELRALARYIAGKNGALWVHEHEGGVAGMVATWPTPAAGTWEIGKMYVAERLRSHGVGAALIASAETFSRNRGATRIELWTDTRFARAHAFYEKHGFVRTGPIRALGDKSATIEFHYAKPIDGIVQLNAAGAASGLRRLAQLDPAFDWRSTAKRVAAGGTILLAGWRGGELSGAVVLVEAPDQPHRAMVEHLCGPADLARDLLARAEQVAEHTGRTLLVAQALTGDATDTACAARAWSEVGRIPGFAIGRDAVIFYKRLIPTGFDVDP